MSNKQLYNESLSQNINCNPRNNNRSRRGILFPSLESTYPEVNKNKGAGIQRF